MQLTIYFCGGTPNYDVSGLVSAQTWRESPEISEMIAGFHAFNWQIVSLILMIFPVALTKCA